MCQHGSVHDEGDGIYDVSRPSVGDTQDGQRKRRLRKCQRQLHERIRRKIHGTHLGVAKGRDEVAEFEQPCLQSNRHDQECPADQENDIVPP